MKAFFKKLSLMLLASGVMFLLCDTGYRIYSHLVPRVSIMDDIFMTDPVLHIRVHRPNSRIVTSIRGTKPHEVSINQFGLRGSSPKTLEKPEGVIRIIVLGESSTEDFYVADGKTWPERLESKLNDVMKASNRVEVLNFGCSGYSTSASRRYFEMNGAKYNPDIVLVYHGNNDFWKAFTALPQIQWMETYVDYEARKTTAWERFLCHSILIDQLRRKTYYMNMERNKAFLKHYWSVPESNKQAVDLTGIEREAIAELDNIYQLCQKQHLKLVIGRQASLMKTELNTAELYAMWEVIRSSLNGQLIRWGVYVDGIKRIKDKQCEFAREHELLWVDAEAKVPKTMEFFIDHIHSTEQGSEAIADVFAEQLLRSGLLRPAHPSKEEH
jgi:hypothetical protein